jgi:hypothetical protein
VVDWMMDEKEDDLRIWGLGGEMVVLVWLMVNRNIFMCLE